ncbi:MAG: aminopeptidase P family protein [Acidimicrobiia bacterium]|nr:aminopeptidase P family protein [Acidimicrobiia bacterium]
MSEPFAGRQAAARLALERAGIDALLLSVGADLPYFTGYEAMPLERLTMLVVPRDGDATLVVPELEAPRVPANGSCEVHSWAEGGDPIGVVAGLVGAAAGVAIGDHTWTRFTLALQAAMPHARFVPASRITGTLRAVKDSAEIAALRAAAHAVDAVAAEMRTRPFGGRTERDVSREFVDRMLAHGHDRPNFAIVGSGPNGASPHHDAGDRVIGEGDVVVCDFGGTMRGYCSDITRMFVVGAPTSEVADTYAALTVAQEAAVLAATVGTPCEAVDAVARRSLQERGLADAFIHRTGHGIGLEAHEDPYIAAGNATPLVAGHAFSIEPGVYFPGRFGMRLEDIVVATAAGPERLNEAPRDLAVVD